MIKIFIEGIGGLYHVKVMFLVCCVPNFFVVMVCDVVNMLLLN